MNTDFCKIINNGVSITSSGTTGEPKTIFRTPENLKACIRVALEAQQISKKSKVLTVTRMTHAGGLLAQSLPAYYAGCDLKIKPFNAFTFLKDFQDYTHTFLTPDQMRALINTKNFKECDLTGKWILGGSDPVTWDLIEQFVSRGALVQPNWGMSEVGPITINKIYRSLDEVMSDKNKDYSGTILGDKFWTDWKIENNTLWVKGDMVYCDGWLNTKDIVENNNGDLYYLGRVQVATSN